MGYLDWVKGAEGARGSAGDMVRFKGEPELFCEDVGGVGLT